MQDKTEYNLQLHKVVREFTEVDVMRRALSQVLNCWLTDPWLNTTSTLLLFDLISVTYCF